MNTEDAARRWAETWERAWPAGDTDAIAALYADDATYRARSAPRPRAGRREALLETNFAVERETECWFAEPLVAGDRAAVEWWGTWVEQGQRLTLAGATFLRFDDADASSITATTGTRSSAASRPTTAGASDRRGSTRSTHLRDGRFSG